MKDNSSLSDTDTLSEFVCMDVINTYVFKVMDLEHLIASIAHFEDLNAVGGVNLHDAFCLHPIQHRPVLMVIHLQTHENQSHSHHE